MDTITTIRAYSSSTMTPLENQTDLLSSGEYVDLGRFRSIIQSKRDQYFFFNIRLASRFDDLEALAESVGDNVRVVSIVLRGGKSHRAPSIKYSSDSVMQIEFICNNVDTPFARKQPEGFTDGINIHCPYVQFYITNLLRHCSETADSGPQDY